MKIIRQTPIGLLQKLALPEIKNFMPRNIVPILMIDFGNMAS